MFYFVDDTGRDGGEDVVGYIRPVGGHAVYRGDGAESDGIFVSPFVSHYADRTHIGKHGEVLPDDAIQAGLFDLLAEDMVGVLQYGHFPAGDVADDADGESGPGEGLAEDDILGQTECQSELPHFVLEETAQGLDYLLEVDDGRQSAYVMMALYYGALTQSALDDVGIDRSLHEIVDFAEFFCFFTEYVDEVFADYLAFALRLPDAAKIGQEPFGSVDFYQVHSSFVAEDAHNVVCLVLAEQSVIDENTGEVIAYGFVKQGRRDRAVHSAAHGAKDFAVAHLCPYCRDLFADEIGHLPVAGGVADGV